MAENRAEKNKTQTQKKNAEKKQEKLRKKHTENTNYYN